MSPNAYPTGPLYRRSYDRRLVVLGIAGSLRRASWNRGLVRATGELAPAETTFETFDLRDVPLYDGDLEGDELPAPVRALKEAIAAADALFIATPEYNWSLSGVLKNALDWASRPAGRSVLKHKPVAIAGATGGAFGTVRAQLALRGVLASTGSYVLPEPLLHIAGAREKFDADGNLVDADTRAVLAAQLEALASWARRLAAL
jgi:chromate reductase